VIDTPGLRGCNWMPTRPIWPAPSTTSRPCPPLPLPRLPARGGARLRGARPGLARPLLSWHKLQREARRHEQDALQRREQLSVWKARSKATREVMRLKRG
jgi:hypothetical protein